jgi:dihydrofolate synthase/folylpolyglutamate synthase
VLHVAGTNGKGSTCRMAAAMLEAHGLRVGVTLSPHLQHVNERFRMDARCISDAALEALILRTQALVTSWAAEALPAEEHPPLTYFEFTVAAAFLWFAEERVDVAVVEVGMGGRLDATNLVAPLVTAITSIGLDHTEQLGPDLASIAGEKAGIVKPGVPVVVGRLPHEALAVVRAVAGQLDAPLSAFGADFDATGTSEAFTWRAEGLVREHLSLALPGDHQVANAAVAVRMMDALPPALRPSEQAIRLGLRAARNPGRLEQLGPDLLLDGAHNVEGASVLAGHLASLPRDRPRTLLLGASSDKDVRGLAVALAPQVDRVLATQYDHPRARPSADVAVSLGDLGVPVLDGGPLEQALSFARRPGDLVIVAGSLFLVGATRDLLGLDPGS